jgi:hypothetical protein
VTAEDSYKLKDICIYIERIGVVVTLEIREVIGSNLRRDIGYPE